VYSTRFMFVSEMLVYLEAQISHLLNKSYEYLFSFEFHAGTVLVIKLWTAVAQWLRCCDTNRKVAGTIPAGVIGIFHWHKILQIALWPWIRHSL